MSLTRTMTEQRSTAYYYGDLERIKRTAEERERTKENELSEYLETNEVVNAEPIAEVPPLRDRPVRQWSLPEYSTPEGVRKLPGETYSTAGTFPMPEQKEKEPLLAELEIVGRVPLNQLESSVRRSRSWYLCCPNVGEDEISRESSWRYSSLRPVTAPPMPNRNGVNFMIASQSTQEDSTALRVERDTLARSLAAERARAAAAARAHDARLAELHGVIAELMRRRTLDKRSGAIAEEGSERSDECESTTQPAEELENDADRSRTDQNDSSSLLSPAELPSPQRMVGRLSDEEMASELHIRVEKPVECESHPPSGMVDECDTSLNLSEREMSELNLSATRCCTTHSRSGGGSCERERGSLEEREVLETAEPLGCSVPQSKIASRVRLKKSSPADSEETRLALQVCAAAGLREALLAADDDESVCAARLSLAVARAQRAEADARVARAALARANCTAHRLAQACAVHESGSVSLCAALRSADRALEVYDVLLALAETNADTAERAAAEMVASQLLARLDSPASSSGPLLPPGPWLAHDCRGQATEWSPGDEERLREHAARLKAETASLRSAHPPPKLFSYHDLEDEIPKDVENVSMLEMEAAVMMQEAATAREERAIALAALALERARVQSLLRNRH